MTDAIGGSESFDNMLQFTPCCFFRLYMHEEIRHSGIYEVITGNRKPRRKRWLPVFLCREYCQGIEEKYRA